MFLTNEFTHDAHNYETSNLSYKKDTWGCVRNFVKSYSTEDHLTQVLIIFVQMPSVVNSLPTRVSEARRRNSWWVTYTLCSSLSNYMAIVSRQHWHLPPSPHSVLLHTIWLLYENFLWLDSLKESSDGTVDWETD